MKKYQMYNGFDTNLFSDYPIIEANNGAEATRKLLKQLNISYTKIVRSASNNVKIKAEPFYYNENGQKVKNGIASWYEIYDGEELYA